MIKTGQLPRFICCVCVQFFVACGATFGVHLGYEKIIVDFVCGGAGGLYVPG